MGQFDFFGGGGDKAAEPQLLEPAWQTELREQLATAAKPGALERIGSFGDPVPFNLAGPTSEQNMGFQELMKFLSGPQSTQSDLFQSAKGEVQDTLDSKYDPYKGEYYKAYKENVMRELQEATDRIKAQRSSREGGIFGGGMTNILGELGETSQGQLSQMLAELYEKERERKLNAVPMAAQLTAFEEAAPMARFESLISPTGGGFERAFEQQGYDTQRAERLRQLQELGLSVDVATGMSTYKPDYYYPGYDQSGAGKSSDMMGSLAQIVGQMGGSQAGSGATTGQTGQAGGEQEEWVQYAMLAAQLMSDVRLKENVKPIKSALSKVSQLKGYTYNYVFDEPENRHGGIMAQDLENVLPDAVTEVDGVKMVRYDAVIGLLIEAVKELAA